MGTFSIRIQYHLKYFPVASLDCIQQILELKNMNPKFKCEILTFKQKINEKTKMTLYAFCLCKGSDLLL